MKVLLDELRTTEQGQPRYGPLLKEITANFDQFHDNGGVWGKGAAKAVVRSDTNVFIGYTYKRKKDVVRSTLLDGSVFDGLVEPATSSSIPASSSDTSIPATTAPMLGADAGLGSVLEVGSELGCETESGLEVSPSLVAETDCLGSFSTVV